MAMGKEKWREAKDYPDIDSLSMSYHRRSNEAVKTLLEYVGATMVFAIALYAVSKESLVLVGGMLFLLCICVWMAIKVHAYSKVAAAIDRGEFTWMTGKLESKFKRDWFDISSGPTYQIKCLGEWREADMTSYNECTIGKSVVLIDLGKQTVCIPIPKGAGWKSLKSMARAQEKKATAA